MCNPHHSVKASKTSFEECELGGGFKAQSETLGDCVKILIFAS